jgi:type I restriction enzyme R subunit
MTARLTESVVEQAALAWLESAGRPVRLGAAGGAIRGAQARVFDFEGVESNDCLAVNQIGVVEGRHSRRPDVVLFVNGLPLAVIELKNGADESATIWTACQQLKLPWR